jgi:hypothetical protein
MVEEEDKKEMIKQDDHEPNQAWVIRVKRLFMKP